MLDRSTLAGAGEEVEVAYYLVHSMGRGGGRSGFAERERQSASNFAALARDEGVERVVYLGGLGDRPSSEHLASRAETARVLAGRGAAADLVPRRHGDRARERELSILGVEAAGLQLSKRNGSLGGGQGCSLQLGHGGAAGRRDGDCNRATQGGHSIFSPHFRMSSTGRRSRVAGRSRQSG